MSRLLALSRSYSTVAVVGLGKNVGKTVTINHLTTTATAAALTLALTSTGRDGEEQDVLTARTKPQIYLPAGAVLATTAPSLARSGAGLEVIAATGVHGALGEIYIARVREAGAVEVSGPSSVGGLKRIVAVLKEQADLVLVDGAMDRLAASAPMVAEAVVLATGAAVGATIESVVQRTVFTARVLMTASVPLGQEGAQLLAQGKYGVGRLQGPIKELPFQTLLTPPLTLLDNLSPEDNCLFVGGALSDPLADILIQGQRSIPNLMVVLPDATKVFVSAARWQRLVAKVAVRVAKPINLIAVTINPIDPRGRRMDGEKLAIGLSMLLPELLVVDPMGGERDEIYNRRRGG